MRVDIVDRFCPSSSSKVSSYTFIKGVSDHYDVLYLGMENGKIFYISIPNGQLPHNIRPLDATKDPGTQHTAEVRCLLFANNKKFTSPQCNGLLFSGSLDRSIKVWSMSGGNQIAAVQTLFGHNSAVTSFVDGTDGSVLSCSEDGTLRVWSPQRGRNMMLYPFFECTFSLTFGKEVWITALTIGILGPWICYAADSNGNIELLKKGSETSEVERYMASFTYQLTRSTKWDKVHALGITHLQLVAEENVLVSLSYDTSCKVLDPSTGQVLFQIANKRKCMYTGASWVKHLTAFYLVDELGMLDVFNLYHERVVETVELNSLTAKQASNVLKCHANQAMCDISRYNQDGYFLTLLASHEAKSGSGSGGLLSSGTVRLKSVGVLGEVVLWNLSNDVNCMEFVGHEGSVVGVSVPSFTAASASRTYTVDAAGNLASLAPAAAPARTAHGTAASAASTLHQHAMRASTLQISSSEKLFFSAGHEDATIRCWDEYDQAESYQFKSKGTSEITVMLAVWHMNRIVTGHENGTVCIWNADTGARVVSRALKHTVSSLAEAASTHSKLLLGADYSGKVVTWNLTLHYLNPTQLIQVGGDMDGFHSRDDPGILSLCFHDRTKTVFSGGNDATVRFWRLHGDTLGGSSCTHKQSVSLLRCTGSFLLSGDEDGFLHLCRIMVSATDEGDLTPRKPGQSPVRGHEPRRGEHFGGAAKGGRSSSPSSGHLPSSYVVTGLAMLCAWNTYPISMRALGDLCELDLTARGGSAFGGGKRILVAQVGPAGTGRAKVWEVWTQKRSSVAGHHRTHRAAGGFEGLRHTAALLHQELADSLGGSLASPAGSQVLGGGSVAGGSGHGAGHSLAGSLEEGGPEDWEGRGVSDSLGKYYVYEDQNPDLYVSVTELYSLNHDKYDISCCNLVMSDLAVPTASAGGSRAATAGTTPPATVEVGPFDALDRFRQSVLVYMGTTAGLIFRFSFRKER